MSLLPDVANYIKQHVKAYDDQANYNATVSRGTKLVSGVATFSVSGVQTLDWLELAEALRSKYGATLKQRNGEWVVEVAPGSFNRTWTLVKRAIGAVWVIAALMMLLFSDTDMIKRMAVAVVSGALLRLVWPAAAEQSRLLQRFGQATAAEAG